jgi:hypothetical protein
MGSTLAAVCAQLKPMGWKRGHPVLYIGQLRNSRSSCTFFRPELQLLLCGAPVILSPLPTAAGPQALSCSESAVHSFAHLYSLRFLSFCWQAPARTCAWIRCAINSTDPRLPVGLWAPFASHRPPTFVVWGYRLLKNWSPSFLRLLR